MNDLLPLNTREQVRRNKLYLINKDKVREDNLNIFYEFVLKYGKLPNITPTGVVIMEIE